MNNYALAPPTSVQRPDDRHGCDALQSDLDRDRWYESIVPRAWEAEAIKIARRLRSAVLVAAALVAAQAVPTTAPALGASAPIVKPSLSLSTYAAGASDVSYTIEFTTSATGSLAANAGTISVEAPAGTFPAAPACANAMTVTDLTTGSSNTTASMCFSEVGSEGNRLVIQTPVGIGGNNRVQVVIPGLVNPAASRAPHLERWDILQ